MWSIRWIRLLGPRSVPRLHEIAIDGGVLAFTLGLSVLSGVFFGLAPALRLSCLDLHAHLKDAGRGSAGMGAVWGGGNSLRRLLVVSELALSVVLLIGAGLLLRSFTRLLDVPPGFDPKGVLTLGLTMTGRRYANGPAVVQAYRELWQRLEQLPGVSAAGGVSALPLSEMYSWGPITIEGRTPPPGELFVNADERIVGGDYFQAMQIPLRRGRFLTSQDTAANPRVAMIDEFMAQRILAQSGSGGQADPHRRDQRRGHPAVDHDRRRSGARQAVHAGYGFAHRASIFRRPRRRCAR